MNSEGATARGRGHFLPENIAVLRDAEQLVKEHGDKADLVAAQLADNSFREGDEGAGFRWMKIFRIIAASHIRQARERLGSLSLD